MAIGYFSIPTAPTNPNLISHDNLDSLGVRQKRKRSVCPVAQTTRQVMIAPAKPEVLEISGVFFTVTPAKVDPLWKLIGSHPQTTDPVILGGSIWLPLKEFGWVQELHASSDGVHEQQLENLRKSIESHPEWTSRQIEDELKQAGARFGPNDQRAFVDTLPFDSTQRFLGTIKITSVEFQSPKLDQKGKLARSALKWIVRADAALPDGSHPQYVFTFEPFEGKLTDLGSPCTDNAWVGG